MSSILPPQPQPPHVSNVQVGGGCLSFDLSGTWHGVHIAICPGASLGDKLQLDPYTIYY